jgi:predicted nucleotidyltransferase
VVETKGIGVETFGLGPRALELIRAVFRRHPEIREVKVFGSRAMGRFEKNSDVDLALWGELDLSLIGRILSELDELPLPYTFDVQAYATIRHAPLRQHIDEVGRSLYQSQTDR